MSRKGSKWDRNTVYCKNCGKIVGYKKKDTNYYLEMREGVTQIGAGDKKHLFSFCNRNCLKKWEELKKRLKANPLEKCLHPQNGKTKR